MSQQEFPVRHCPFLDLPSEIHFKIYETIFEGNSIHVAAPIDCRCYSCSRRKSGPIDSILLACSRCHAEAVPALYSRTTWILPSFQQLCKFVFEPRFSKGQKWVRCISLHRCEYQERRFLDRHVVDLLPRLQNVIIRGVRRAYLTTTSNEYSLCSADIDIYNRVHEEILPLVYCKFLCELLDERRTTRCPLLSSYASCGAEWVKGIYHAGGQTRKSWSTSTRALWTTCMKISTHAVKQVQTVAPYCRFGI